MDNTDLDNLKDNESTIINDITLIDKEINELEQKNNLLKKNLNNVKSNNNSASKLYFDTNDMFNRYKLSNILIGIFFIIGAIFYYKLQYNYDKFIYFINSIKFFSFKK
tara:strand:- start:1798 stop:2121 length:324 start_codon:yes stop_codon:yes gene_type:complete